VDDAAVGLGGALADVPSALDDDHRVDARADQLIGDGAADHAAAHHHDIHARPHGPGSYTRRVSHGPSRRGIVSATGRWW